MKASDISFQNVLNGPNQYVIPVFQRYYSWDKDNWEQLWSDIAELLEPENASRTHFMGSLVLVPEPNLPDKVPVFQVIDGQQRVVTLSLLLCTIRDAAKGTQAELAEEITQTLLVHPFKKEQERFRVYPRQRDRDHYVAAVEGTPVPSGRVREALDYFRGRIEELRSAEGVELRSLLDLLRSRLDFVYITLEGENPYRIFRSLNSTGVDLSEADLIRNFVFMHVPVQDQDKFDDVSWKPLESHFETTDEQINSALMSAYFRDFLMRNGQYVSPTATFETFDDTYSKSHFSPSDLASELRVYADIYDTVRGVVPHADGALRLALAKLQQLESSTTYPLLLNLMNRVREGTMPTIQLIEAVEMLAGFIMRRFVCRESSRAYGRWFVTMCRELETGEGDPLAALDTNLRARGFPDDERFKLAFLRYPFYGSAYGRSVLEALELAHPHKERADISLAGIEHIMPQTLTPAWIAELGTESDRVYAEWLHTVGNLTLSAYNPEMSNKPFAEKRQEYAKSNIFITRQIAENSNWAETEITERGRNLANIATTIWRGPRTS